MQDKLDHFQFWLQESSDYSLDVRIIVDGSQDNTLGQVQAIVDNCKNSRLSVTTGEFGNPGGARNKGLSDISSTWICFWDSDDLPILKNIFEVIENTSTSTNAIIGNFLVRNFADSYGSHPIPSSGKSRIHLLSIVNRPGLWRWVFRTDLITGLNFPDLNIGEDQCYLAKVLALNPIIAKSNKPFYSYSINRGDSQTGRNEFNGDLDPALLELRNALHKCSGRYFRIFIRLLIFRMRITQVKKRYIS
jgi:glycosyltransferase involved in cell wall biosynthesis